MNKYIKKIHWFIVLISVITFACEPDIEIPKQDEESQYTMLYMPQAEGGVRTLALDIKQTNDEILLGAAYGGVDVIEGDITVSLMVDASLVEDYNAEKGTNYAALPTDAYTLDNTSVTIPDGKFSSSVARALIQTQALSPYEEYMFAVKIESSNTDIVINEDLDAALYIIDVNYPMFERVNWEVTDFSSEEPKEAEWGNGGLVIHSFDGESSTFWHSQWDGGEAPPPHWFVVDMAQTQSVHGFAFLPRQSDNNGKPQEITLEFSVDGTEWSAAETITLENSQSLQEVFLQENFNESARYFRLTVVQSYFANYTHLAEINVF